MKIKLNEDTIVNITPREGYLGCHLIDCESCGVAPCNKDACVLQVRGLAGDFYPLEKVEDLLAKEG